MAQVEGGTEAGCIRLEGAVKEEAEQSRAEKAGAEGRGGAPNL